MKTFEGILTALITPMADGAIDERALGEHVERQIAAGIHGLVVCGTTGEAAALSEAERLQAIRLVVQRAAGRVPIVAGTGSNSTRASVALTEKAAELGVDGALVVTPYYVKPTQAGLVAHFREVARVGVPLVAYNVPSRTGVSLTPETAGELAAIDGVVALKEASGDMNLDSRILQRTGGRLALLSGDDFTILPLLALGGRGAISVLSNAAPAETVSLFERFRAGELAAARELHHRLYPLMQALFLESNPIPVKAACAMLGWCRSEIRLPLLPLAEEHRPRLRAALSALGLLPEGA